VHILYLEDDPLDAEALRRALTRLRPDVALQLSSTPAAALIQVEAHLASPIFDVVIVDVSLPEMNGFEFIDRMSRYMAGSQRPRVVVFSSSEHRLDMAEAQRIRADAYVVKTADPSCFDHLVAALDRFDPSA
jgi:DNA-binding NarL/FixJ family response regulator